MDRGLVLILNLLVPGLGTLAMGGRWRRWGKWQLGAFGLGLLGAMVFMPLLALSALAWLWAQVDTLRFWRSPVEGPRD